jgi:preprotein translocase subunit SecY
VIQTIRKAWGIPELRKKIIFTLLILLIYRDGNAIPVPYVNVKLLTSVPRERADHGAGPL